MRVLRPLAVAYLVASAGLMTCTLAPMIVGWRPHLIDSGSMRPSLRPGTVLLTAAQGPSAPRVGAIVLVEDPDVPGRRYAHRVVSRTDGPGWTLRTKGDAIATVDRQVVRSSAVVGVGRLAVPWIGLPAVWGRDAKLVRMAAWLVLTAAAAWLAVGRRHGAGDATGLS